MAGQFEQTTIVLYGQCKEVSFLCLDLIWKPIGEKVRFVLVRDGSEQFILMCSDVELLASDIIRAYSYRFKIEVSFKMLKHLMGAFSYRFWTSVWPRIGKNNVSDLSSINDQRSRRLIRQTANAIEGVHEFWLHCHRYSSNHLFEFSSNDLGEIPGVATDSDVNNTFGRSRKVRHPGGVLP